MSESLSLIVLHHTSFVRFGFTVPGSLLVLMISCVLLLLLGPAKWWRWWRWQR